MPDQKEVIQQWIQHANTLATQGRWDEALAAYNKVVEVDQHNLDVRQHIISISLKKGNYSEVIHQHMDCAEIYHQQGDRDAAIERYEEILRLQETVEGHGSSFDGGGDAAQVHQLVSQVKPEIYHQIGDYHLERENVDLALQYLRKSQELQPGRWDTHMALGRAYMKKSMDKEAIGEFQEVLRLAPDESALAYENLGEVFVRQGRPPHSTVVWFQHAAEYYLKKQKLADATRAYERILEFDPQNKEILYNLGELYAQQGLKEQAVRTYRTLAELYEKEGLLDKVIQLYETVVSWDPDSQWATDKLISIYEGVLGRNSNNISVRVRLIEHLAAQGRRSELCPHYLALAQGHVERGMLDEAVKASRQLLELEPQNIQAREILGDIYLKKDMHSEALDIFQQIVKIYRAQGNEQAALQFQQRLVEVFPQAPELLYQVALSLRDKGDHEGALRELDRIIAQRPDDIKALAYKAELLGRLNRLDESIQTYARVLQMDPQRTDVRKLIIELLIKTNRLEESSRQIGVLPPDDPDIPALRSRIILLYIETRRLDQAEQELAYLPEENERRLVFRKELVKLYLDAGNLDKAFEGLPQIPRSDRERNSLVTRLLEIPLAKGDLETAAKTIHRLPEDDPLRLSFQRRLVASYVEAGRLDEAADECLRLPADDEARSGFVSRLIGGFLSQGELEKASREIYRLSEGDPLRNSFMGQLIEAYLSAGELERAAKEVARLSKEDEIRPRYHRRIIQAYLNASKFEEAERDILALDDTDPEKRSFLRLLIQKYLTLGQLDRVREVVNRMPDDMEEKKQYLDGLVHNYLDTGDLAGARHQIYQMAESEASQGNHKEAERLYREILAYQPADAEIRLRLSQEIAVQGQTERAREGMLVLAGRFHRENNVTSAADVYSRMLEVDPNDLNARYKLGTLWAEQGQTAQALEQFGALAKVYLEQNLPEVAQKVLNKILELDPKDMEHRRQAIRLLIRNLRFEEATEHYRALMGIHLERGEVDEALECVKEIVNLQPLNLELRQSLGAMFLRAGFLEQGQNLLEELARDAEDKKDNERLLRVLWTLVRSFEENEQWEISLEYRERIADLLRSLDQWQEAHEEYLKIIEGYLIHEQKEPSEPIFVKLIDGFFRNRVVPEGLSKLDGLEESLADAGHRKMALLVRERTASIMERLDEWDRAIEMYDGISERYLELGEVELGLEFRRRAADQALGHDRIEQGVEHLFVLAGATVEHRGLEEARPVLDELRKTAQDDVGYLERLGDVLFKHSLFEEARPIYAEVLEREPGRPEALSRVAIIYAREGRLEEAADVAKQIFSKGLVSRIIKEYKEATGFTEGDAGSHVRLGQFYRQMGFLEEAIREFLVASQDPSRLLGAYNHLAQCFRQQGYLELAVKQFQKALDQPGYRDEELLELRFNLACALEDMGRHKAALAAFQECYVIDIRYREVAQRIEALMANMHAEV
ncbi:MAG: tetratricopeptide repeat protein [Candidatus Eremiobacteraeota bacterium]|nr:tetratricopeptide repeat protein [Candidatus Eremiobacteraeota bacterium]